MLPIGEGRASEHSFYSWPPTRGGHSFHDERLKQRARLEQEGFSLQVWSAAVLKKKLRKQRQIVRHFFPWFEDYICGPSAELDIQSYSQRATIAALAKQFGEVAEGEHADLRKLWQEGHPRKALSKLRKIKNETLTWEVLPPVTKAKLLRPGGTPVVDLR